MIALYQVIAPKCWLYKLDAEIIISSLRDATNKLNQCCWKGRVLWCVIMGVNPYKPSEKNMIEYLTYLMKLKLSNSVINTNKLMLISTLLFWRWMDKEFVIITKINERLLCHRSWKTKSKILVYLRWFKSSISFFFFWLFLMPLGNVTLYRLTSKLIALIAQPQFLGRK